MNGVKAVQNITISRQDTLDFQGSEAATGKIPSGKNIGDRKGTYTLQEVVIFNEDGMDWTKN